MDIAAVLSVLGQGPGRAMLQAAGIATISDAGPSFRDAFADVAEARVHESTQSDPVGGGESGEVAPEPSVLAETMLFSSTAAPMIADLVAAAAEEGRFRVSVSGLKPGSDGAFPKPSALPLLTDRAEGGADTLPEASNSLERPTQAFAAVSGAPDLPDRQAGHRMENPAAPVGGVAQNPGPLPASKGRVLPQPLDPAPQGSSSHQLSLQSPAREGPAPDALPTAPNENPLTHEEEAAGSRRLEVAAPLRAAPPPDRRLPIGLTDPVGLPDPTEATNSERREVSNAFADRGLIPKGAETASRSNLEAGRRPEGRADAQGDLTGLASQESKDRLARPKVAAPLPGVATPVPDQVPDWPAGLPEGGPGRLRGLPLALEPAAQHPLHPSGPGTPHIAHSPHAIGMQLAERMPGTAGQPVEVTLAPEELGKVRMTIWATDGGLTLQLVADRPETLDLMRRHIDQLAQDFRDMGFERLSFAFGQGQNENQKSGQAAPSNPPEEKSANLGVTPAAGPARRSAPLLSLGPDDRLDLRF